MKSADVVIIGGGVQGLSNGYFLAKRGLKVIVVERGDLASGTSCRNDGDNFECDAAPGFITEFTNAAVNLVKDVAKSLDYDVDWLEKGMVVLPESEEEMQIARQIYQEKRAAGIDVRLIPRRIFPAVWNTATAVHSTPCFLRLRSASISKRGAASCSGSRR